MGFLENFYGVLFHPNETLDKLKQTQPLFQAFLIVLIVSILNPIVNFSFFNIESFIWLGLGIMSALFSGVIGWLFIAAFIDILASIFKQSGKIKEFLVLSGFALLPWIFLAPVNLFKTGGILGNIIGVILGLTVWVWVLVLTFKAVMKVYNLSPARVAVLIIVPFLGSFIALSWFIGFISTFVQLVN